uniref:Odorant-binding protein n=2 Tax=Periplaneta americana TaxID=6978 RepID=B6E9U9_PERAM|nr:odorant-binding protein [Periplaneta americana]
MPKISDDDKKLMKECKGDISSEDEGEHDKPKGKHFCGAACLFEKSNMMKDGSVDQDAFKKEILARYPDNMHPTVTSAIEKCVPKANSIAKDMGNVESEGQKCNPAPLITMACTYTTIQNTCPEDLKVKSDECDKRRAKCKEISKKFD